MKLNLPNKITVGRIFIAFAILLIMVLPWEQMNIEWAKFEINSEMIDLKYIVVGFLFMIASITDFLDGYIARSRNLVTDFGKTMDAIADKVLVNGLLIVLAYNRVIPIIIPVIIITRDIITDSCKTVCSSKGKVVAASKLGKFKTIFMMVGLTLVLFYDYPLAFLNINVSEILILIAAILSLVSGIQYVANSMPYLLEDQK